MMVIVAEDLTSNPAAVRNGQSAVFSLKLQSADQIQETIIVAYDLPSGSGAVFQENGTSTITTVTTVFSVPTTVQRSYAIQNATPGSILAVAATVRQAIPRTSPGNITILL